MTKKKTIRMTKEQDQAIAIAQVAPIHVAKWEAQGWVADKPKSKDAE